LIDEEAVHDHVHDEIRDDPSFGLFPNLCLQKVCNGDRLRSGVFPIKVLFQSDPFQRFQVSGVAQSEPIMLQNRVFGAKDC